MRALRTIVALFATAAFQPALLLKPTPAAPPETVSLMETLSAWKYPGSTLLGGAGMSDGGDPTQPSLKCRAILTTPDSFEKVDAFYKTKVEARAGAGGPGADARSVSTLDDSRGRPVKVRLIVVNRADSTTTLVISRAEGETATHVAWQHFLRLGGKR